MYEIKDLSKSYQEGEHKRLLFEGLSLSLPKKGFFVLLGRSGSGKSTLFHILSLLEKPDKGALLYKDKRIDRLSPKERAKQRKESFGFLFQHYHLEASLSAEENVALPLLLKGDSLEEALRKAEDGLANLGLKEIANREAGLLSGGEKARVAYLRAILPEPEILFGDEPTGALDRKNAHLLLSSLKEYSKRHLVFIVTHDRPSILPYADAIYRLEEGKLVPEKEMPHQKAKEGESTITKENEKGLRKLVERRFRKRLFAQNLPVFLSSSFLFLSFLLGLSLLMGGNHFLKTGERNSLLANLASISEGETIPIEGSTLSLSRSKRPEKKDVLKAFSDISDLHIEEDYSYFFPLSLPYRHRGYPRESVSFHPIYDLSLRSRSQDFLLSGFLPKGKSLDYVLINESMAKLLGEDPLGERLEVLSETELLLEEKYHTVSLSFRFEVLGVVRDFPFLSLPRVFYSYPALKMKMEGTFVEGKSLGDYVKEASGSSPLSSYGYLAFFEERDVSRLRKEKRGNYSFSNVHWRSFESFETLWGLLSKILVPALLMELLLVAFGIYCLSERGYLENRHFLSLLDALGTKEGTRSSLFGRAGLLSLFSALLLAHLLIHPLCSLVSSFLFRRFGIENLALFEVSSFLGVPYLLPILSFLFVLLLFLLSIRLPLYLLSRKGIAKELKDE